MSQVHGGIAKTRASAGRTVAMDELRCSGSGIEITTKLSLTRGQVNAN